MPFREGGSPAVIEENGMTTEGTAYTHSTM